MNPLGLFLEPPGPLLTHLHTVYIAYSERLPTRLNPLAERTCFSQVVIWDNAAVQHYAVSVGLYPIVTLEKQLPNMIGNLV